MITTTGLTRIYGKGENAVTAINNLDIRINDGELVAITGKSGSGKTTLLNILGGLDKATGGSVCYDDTDITKLADTALADFRLNKIGFVFQFYDRACKEVYRFSVRQGGYKRRYTGQVSGQLYKGTPLCKRAYRGI